MMPAPRVEQNNLRRKLAWLYFGAVMLAYAIILLTGRWPAPSVDYPEWVYQGVIFHGALTGHPMAGYVLKHYPVPFSSTTGTIGVLNLIMSWQLAGKLFLCAYFALAALGTWMLARGLRVESPLLLIAVPTTLFLNSEFWWGRINFEMGMCLVMILVALLLEEARSAAIAAVLVVLFFVHMETCACAMLFLGLWVLSTKRWRYVWASVPTLLLCFWYAAARILGGNADAESVPHSTFRFGSKLFFLFKVNTYLKIFGYINAHGVHELSQSELIFGKPLFLTLFVLYLLLAALCYCAIVRGAWRQRNTRLRPLSAFALILLPCSLLIPQIFLGSTDPGSRLVLMGAAIGFFLVDWSGHTGKVIATLCIVFCLANVWQFALLDHEPYRAEHVRDLPDALVNFGHVQTTRSLRYYEHLETGEMDLGISTTSLYLMSKPGQTSAPTRSPGECASASCAQR